MPNRIANLRIGMPFPGDNAPAVCYFLEDHLGPPSVGSFTLETTGTLFSRENEIDFRLAEGALFYNFYLANKPTNEPLLKDKRPWFNSLVAYKKVSTEGFNNAKNVWNLYTSGNHPNTAGFRLFIH